MSTLDDDLKTFRIYGQGLSKFESGEESDTSEDALEMDDEDDDPLEEVTSEDLEGIDLRGLAQRIVRLMQRELLNERERYG